MLPRDNYAFIGDPPFDDPTIRPKADEVHVSCTFSWDKPEAKRLALAWGQYYEKVRIGGPAIEYTGTNFIPGQYIMPGITFTSRGCNNKCAWCLVPKREDKLNILPDFQAGHIIQDNNFLQCDHYHIERVFEMLRYQGKPVTFSGGLDSRLVTESFIEELRTVPIEQIFLACDTEKAIKPLREAVKSIGLPRDKVRCYVLLKFNPNETIDSATDRMLAIWEAGAMPFAQLYQPEEKWIDYPKEWREFQRKWSRPAIMKSMLKSIPERNN
jgi:hypothetical protein